MMNFNHATVDDIPLIWCEPPKNERRHLVIWLNGFSGSKESVKTDLESLAEAGFVALAFDPYQHGERLVETVEELRDRIRGNIRRNFWPILAHTAEETSKVIDWAIGNLSVEEAVGMGGVSMGGDISVTAAGIDHRIAAISALVATPDWLRPGSFEPPGEPDETAQCCYDRCNPLTHLEHYVNCPAITFQSGAEDQQVPPDGGQRFAEALSSTYANCPEKLKVVLHEGVAHGRCDAMMENSIAWFSKWLGT